MGIGQTYGQLISTINIEYLLIQRETEEGGDGINSKTRQGFLDCNPASDGYLVPKDELLFWSFLGAR